MADTSVAVCALLLLVLTVVAVELFIILYHITLLTDYMDAMKKSVESIDGTVKFMYQLPWVQRNSKS